MESISQPSVSGAKRKLLWRAALLASTCFSGIISAAPAHAQSLPANTTPTGGSVAAGSASISQAPDLTTINQTSQKTIIDWQTFNVGSAATVQFNQPSSTSTALNYVLTPSPSIIAGKINANGQLILVNQSGIIFTKGSEVDAQALVATTNSVSNQDFLAGKLNFTGAPRPGASIVNDGKITVKDTGLVGLIAPQVANNGIITAKLGQVVLAGASAFTLDMYGDRLISLDVTKAVRAVDVGGKLVPALVTNSGVILADGGKITLTAQDADALVTQLINAGGTIRADSVGTNTGTISVTGMGGNISIAGNLLAQGAVAGTKGGAVQVLTDGTVVVAAGATINTSGDAGGGVVALGTDITRAQKGAADTTAPRANTVLVAPGAMLLSDATGTGNGGDVTLLSTNYTDFAGAISIQGGPHGGNGGVAEISSGNVINLSGTVADLAVSGQNGEILLDPATLVVGSGNPSAGSSTAGSTTTFGAGTSPKTSYISGSTLDTLSGTIILEASSLISVTDSVSIGSANTVLSLVSGGDISITNSIYVNGSLEIDATNSLSVGAGLSAAGNMLLSSGTAGTYIDASVSAASVLGLVSPGTIFEGIAGSISAATLTSNGAADGAVTLDGASNSIASLGSFTATNLTLNDAGSLSVTGPVTSFGNITLSATSLDFAGSLSSANLSLASTSSITESTGAISTGTLTGTASGNVTLNSATNTIASLGSFTATNLSLNDAGSLSVTGPVTSSGNITLSATSLDFAGSLSSANLSLTSTSSITESTGAISTGTLTGTASGNVTLNSATN
ncbi:MAG TPA: filamentous hemagglutinin N-terminal domain-containing protein, partial [Acidocella sp.]|nr:filamentous hemagglutinin N-terminal domain-containing protein [Acidocella sp.]